MKKIVLPPAEFSIADRAGGVRQMSAAEQLRIIVSMPSTPQESFTLEDMRQRLPIIEKIEALEKGDVEELLLEDAQYAIVLEAVKTSSWSGVSRDALQLCEAVEKAESIDVGPLESVSKE